MGVWTNADKPEEAAQARGLRRRGIGLCRTATCFGGERLESCVARSSSASQATRAKEKLAAGDAIDADAEAAIALVDAAMPSRVLQQGDSRHLQGDGRAPGRHPPDRPAAPRVLPNLEEHSSRSQGPRRPACQRRGQGASRDDQVATRRQTRCFGLARRAPRADDPGLREGPDEGHPQRPDRGQASRRQPDREDHDPAGRAPERVEADQGAAGSRGRVSRGRRRRGRCRLQVRHDDRGAARRARRR